MSNHQLLNITEAGSYGPLRLPGDYGILLDQQQVIFRKTGNYYEAGEIVTEQYELFMSVVVVQLPLLLTLILPYFKIENIPFRLVCNQETHFRLNHGEFGLKQVGRILLFYPNGKKDALMLAAMLEPLTGIFKGPNLSLYKQVGQIMFSNFQLLDRKKMFSFSIFRKPSHDMLQFKSKKVIGKYFRPTELLRFSPKGEIHKGINLRCMKWCIIKRGRYCAFEDIHGRTIRDRLSWQAFLCCKLGETAPVQKTIAYLEDKTDTYLVLEYIEGIMLGEKIRQINPGKLPFIALGSSEQKHLLQVLLRVVMSMEKLHAAGIVHRDINEGNLIVAESKEVFIIDLEMAVDLRLGLPSIPFFPGASGYRAPEQSEAMPAGFEEDIYSLGCLLYYMITLQHPDNFAREDRIKTKEHLDSACSNEELICLCMQCTEPDPGRRPALCAISNEISVSLLTN